MKLSSLPSVQRKLQKASRRMPWIVSVLHRKLKYLEASPFHPSLRIHKLIGKKDDVWSLSVTHDLRLIFQYVEDGILLIDFGTHDEVY